MTSHKLSHQFSLPIVVPPALKPVPGIRHPFASMEVLLDNHSERRRADAEYANAAVLYKEKAAFWAGRGHPVRAADLFLESAGLVDQSIDTLGANDVKTRFRLELLRNSNANYWAAIGRARRMASSVSPEVYGKAALCMNFLGYSPRNLDAAAKDVKRSIAADPSFAIRVRVIGLQSDIVLHLYEGRVQHAITLSAELPNMIPHATAYPMGNGARTRFLTGFRTWVTTHFHASNTAAETPEVLHAHGQMLLAASYIA